MLVEEPDFQSLAHLAYASSLSGRNPVLGAICLKLGLHHVHKLLFTIPKVCTWYIATYCGTMSDRSNPVCGPRGYLYK